jgi:cell fate (sporulation/competence/biofilm development) regulator YlbF (YheA/YmcA/DUF963 family)
VLYWVVAGPLWMNRQRLAQPFNIMTTQTEESVITQKTRELCQAILEQPDVQAMRQKMDAFMADDKARGQYDALMMKGQMLQQKQQAGAQLDQAEIDAFEQLRESFLNNPVAKGFLDAQEDMQKVQASVSEYVTKTFELGRVPEETDLDSGSCGHGCGCHH